MSSAAVSFSSKARVWEIFSSKPLVVVLLETDCGPCDAFDRFVFPDEAVAAWLREEVVAVRRVDDAAVTNEQPTHVSLRREGREWPSARRRRS